MRINNSTLCVQTQACNDRDTGKFCLFLIILVLGFIALLSFAAIVDADDTDAAKSFTVDGLKYETTSKNAVRLLGCERSGDIEIPAWVEYSGKRYNVTSIDGNAFVWKELKESLTSVTIPGSVKSICWGLFQDCWSLNSVVIGNGVKYIGGDAFSNCSALTSITIPDSVESIGRCAFMCCYSLESVVLGKGVKIIDEYAFYNCSALTSVTIPDNVTKINWEAFMKCYSLKSVTLGKGVRNIGYNVFRECSELTDVTILGTKKVIDIGGDVFEGCKKLQNIYVPDKKFKDYSKSKCWSPWKNYLSDKGRFTEDKLIYETTSSDTVTFIGCERFGNIVIPSSVEHFGKHYKVTSIDEDAFKWDKIRKSLTSVTIPGSIRSISKSAFLGCWSLRSVVICEGVEIIDEFAFYNCSALTSVTIPDSVTTINQGAFRECYSLKSVTLGKGVRNIGCNVFRECSELTNVTILGAEKVIDIGEDVFKDCEKLQNIYVPDNKYVDYINAEGWSAMKDHFIPSNEIVHEKITACSSSIQACTGQVTCMF